MDRRIEQLRSFLDQAHSVYHGIRLLTGELEQEGYRALPEEQEWKPEPGGRYYVTRGGSSLVAFRIPHEPVSGFMISAGHSDRPTFKVKENGELKGAYTRLATEPYGGMLMSTWLDRPLSVAGRVFVQTENGIECKLVDIDRDLLLIPNVAIHMNRKANEGVPWNPAVDMLPMLGGGDGAGKLQKLLEETAGGKIMGHDLYLYNRQKTALWGVSEEYLSAPALDDLACAWCCTQGFLNAPESRMLPVLCVFDSEEVGSASVQGAGSTFLEDVLTRICHACGLDLRQQLRRSFMISADNAHAVHPNHPEYADASNAPVMGGGVVLKFNAAQRYTTDGLSAAVFRKFCGDARVPVQTYYNRADMPGGSTLGNISLAHVSVSTVDIGLPQLAMHSSFETVSVQDVLWLCQAMECCYGAQLEVCGDGTLDIRTKYGKNA